MTTSYRPLANEVGCLSAEIYKEIRRCLRLRGGVVIDGIKWIWKTSEELAERLGVNEKTIRRHLKTLVQMGWLKREQHQKKWGMRSYHYCLGDNAPLRTGYIAQPVEHPHGMQGVRKAEPVDTSDLKTSGKKIELPPSKQSVSSAAQQPFQSRRFDRSEVDKMSGSINRNTTTKNSPPGQNSLNSQGASRQTEQGISGEGRIRTHALSSTERGIRSFDNTAATGVLKRSDLFKDQRAKSLVSIVSGTSASSVDAVPAHWPEEQMTMSLKMQVIEAARQLAFPGRQSRAFQ